jgi:hypothetical protein
MPRVRDDQLTGIRVNNQIGIVRNDDLRTAVRRLQVRDEFLIYGLWVQSLFRAGRQLTAFGHAGPPRGRGARFRAYVVRTTQSAPHPGECGTVPGRLKMVLVGSGFVWSAFFGGCFGGCWRRDFGYKNHLRCVSMRRPTQSSPVNLLILFASYVSVRLYDSGCVSKNLDFKSLASTNSATPARSKPDGWKTISGCGP